MQSIHAGTISSHFFLLLFSLLLFKDAERLQDLLTKYLVTIKAEERHFRVTSIRNKMTNALLSTGDMRMVLHRDNGNGDDNIYLHSEPEEEEEEEDADEAVEEMAKPRPKKRSPTDIAKVN